jgi:acyl-CoA thioesterase FadM
MGSWHESKLRVRYEETDTMQVVYYAKVFVWMEVGRVNLMRDIGHPYRDWRRRGWGCQSSKPKPITGPPLDLPTRFF